MYGKIVFAFERKNGNLVCIQFSIYVYIYLMSFLANESQLLAIVFFR